MTTYWITFRLTDDASYKQRYDDLVDALNEVGSAFWDEPTSFVAIETDMGIGALASLLKSTINPGTDILVIREIGRDNTRYIGEPKNGFLYFFPNAKKV
ncbi:hypothetical protein KZ813_17890 [Sphingomonas sp. RHCKR7]|uniref:hypothetical protein n=1 Tax=Sphingomonas folli TaxID=2862497 RepID=UPI001CA588C1|nr:hypothetical protein [Sphingomonas folli]MBW6528717.1 hypothetical protein [Sphingomonas folli]